MNLSRMCLNLIIKSRILALDNLECESELGQKMIRQKLTEIYNNRLPRFLVADSEERFAVLQWRRGWLWQV